MYHSLWSVETRFPNDLSFDTIIINSIIFHNLFMRKIHFVLELLDIACHFPEASPANHHDAVVYIKQTTYQTSSLLILTNQINHAPVDN